MSDHLYAVSSGSYSYYTVHALFEDKVLAEAHAAELGEDPSGDKAFVEEFPLLDRLPRRITWYVRWVRLNEGDSDMAGTPNEGARECISWEYEEDAQGLTPRPKLEATYTYPWLDGEQNPHPGYYNLTAKGLDEGAVNQAITDQIAQWRAQGYYLHNVQKPPRSTTYMYVPYG